MKSQNNYAAVVEYDGTNYSGWQRQPFLSSTIQEHIEIALSQIANENIEITCAGRTDAGVHALGQVFHFKTHAIRSPHAWLAGSNRYLPNDIRLQSICQVQDDFHARYSAENRHYRYIILNGRQPSAIFHKRCHWHPKILDIQKIQEAAQFLCGEHDFSAFRAAQCQAKSPFRFIKNIHCQRQNHWIYIDVIGNAFLHHMVRNIVGSLLMVGDGRRPAIWLKEVLESKDRRKAGITAPAYGLYFYHVYYKMPYQTLFKEQNKKIIII